MEEARQVEQARLFLDDLYWTLRVCAIISGTLGIVTGLLLLTNFLIRLAF